MSLGPLIVALRPLLADPEKHWSRLVALLDAHRHLAEHEVARHAVSRALLPRVRELLADPDPRQRRRALDMVRATFSRSAAADVLRRLVKDPDTGIQTRARATRRALRLDDVALRDTREGVPRDPKRVGGWNPTGWSYGLYLRRGRDRSKRKARDLRSLGLPALAGPDDLAAFLGLADAAALTRWLRPGSARGSAYVEFDVPKPNGGVRRVAAPRPGLRRLQRAILDGILARAPVHEAAHGFVRGRSIATNASAHAGARLLVRVDLEDFFPSIHYRRVAGLFEHYGYSSEVAALLAGLCTYRPLLADGTIAWPGRLPQGAPTSPAIANLASRRLDARLTGLARRVGAVYTRYADDLTFSFQREPERLGRVLWWIDQLLQQEGFAENRAKRRVLRPSGQLLVTGLVVNQGVHVPREARRRFRAILHNCRRTGVAAQANGRADFRAYLQGFAAWVHMVDPVDGARLLAEVRALPP